MVALKLSLVENIACLFVRFGVGIVNLFRTNYYNSLGDEHSSCKWL